MTMNAQSGFHLKDGAKRDKIGFELINNLPIIPVEINGTKLSFILDTGVKSTLLFSLEQADSIQFNNSTPILLQGLGKEGKVEALKSQNNFIKVGDAIDNDHTIYIIFDSALNFSPRMGVPIHGILGSDFFQNFVVKINYTAKNITVYNPDKFSLRKCRKCEDKQITLFNDKPYITLEVASEEVKNPVTLLIDSGSSDAMWLFEEFNLIKNNPQNYFKDFLGLGLSGDIYGKRAQIDELILGKIILNNVNVSFPEEEAINNARNFEERKGSIGGGFLNKFTVTFDYPRRKVRFKKNSKFKEPFHYNMSGITLEHDGMELVKKEKFANVKKNDLKPDRAQIFSSDIISVTTQFEFSMVPRFVVVDVRKDSPAAIAGVKNGDEVISVNGKPCYEYKLYELIAMFSEDEGKRISLEINRDGVIQKVRFTLKSLL